MNLKTEFFLAFKYLKPKRNAVSIITCISIIGVALGVSVLLVVLAVMTGFTDLMKDKLMQTGAHLQIYNRYGGCIEDTGNDIKLLSQNNVEATPVINAAILVQKGTRFVPKMVLGVEPDKLPKRFDLKGSLIPNIDGNKVLDLSRRKVIISEDVASELGLYVGSRVLIHSPQRLAEMIKIDKGGSFGLKNSSEVYLPMEFTVSSLYSFNKYDFDKQIIFMNLDDADELFGVPWGSANIIYGWVPDPFNMKKLVKTLETKLKNRDFITWKKLNQRILGVLEVEKDMMFFILITIVFVAAFCIANTLIVVVIQKTREIGLLKALGASSGMVLRVFLLHGVIVGFLGSIIGTLLGFTILYYRNDGLRFMREITGRDLFPKEFYFFNELPAHMVPTDVIFVCLISIMLCTLGALIPAAWAANLDPAKALRYE